jgi:MauM/NapG family ferredoxin protein
MKRRQLLQTGVLSGLGVALWLAAGHVVRGDGLLGGWPQLARRGLLRPPGALPEGEFLARCIRCQRCAQSCGAGAIRLLGPGTGALEGTPYIVAERTACNLCLACGPACPTEALAPLDDMAQAEMGTARVDEQLCVSHNGTGICGACFTICPLRGRAITQGAHNAPTVHDEACVGCGLCEEVCIVKGDKAIRVLSGRDWA